MIQSENESKFFEVSDKLVREDLLKTSKLDKARNPKIEKIATIQTEGTSILRRSNSDGDDSSKFKKLNIGESSKR
jgi:hypothetical protein